MSFFVPFQKPDILRLTKYTGDDTEPKFHTDAIGEGGEGWGPAKKPFKSGARESDEFGKDGDWATTMALYEEGGNLADFDRLFEYADQLFTHLFTHLDVETPARTETLTREQLEAIANSAKHYFDPLTAKVAEPDLNLKEAPLADMLLRYFSTVAGYGSYTDPSDDANSISKDELRQIAALTGSAEYLSGRDLAAAGPPETGSRPAPPAATDPPPDLIVVETDSSVSL